MESRKYRELVLQHFIQLESSHCTFCSALEKNTRRLCLFLFFDSPERIYQRNGLKDTWEEVVDDEESQFLRRKFDSALEDDAIPRFPADPRRHQLEDLSD